MTRPAPISRRHWLSRAALGFGGLALNALLSSAGRAATRPPHFAPRARSFILLFMDGGVSQVDSFDPKPRLNAENGQPMKLKIDATQFDNNGAILASPWEFKRYGQA